MALTNKTSFAIAVDNRKYSCWNYAARWESRFPAQYVWMACTETKILKWAYILQF